MAARTLTSGIVPPFTSGAQSYPGLNWTAENQVIYANGLCNGVVPTATPTPTPTPVITPEPGVVEPSAGEPPQAEPEPSDVEGVSVPEAATIPESVPAGGGGSQPGTPLWAVTLALLGAIGASASSAVLARRIHR